MGSNPSVPAREKWQSGLLHFFAKEEGEQPRRFESFLLRQPGNVAQRTEQRSSTPRMGVRLPPFLPRDHSSVWQSARPITVRSLVRSQPVPPTAGIAQLAVCRSANPNAGVRVSLPAPHKAAEALPAKREPSKLGNRVRLSAAAPTGDVDKLAKSSLFQGEVGSSILPIPSNPGSSNRQDSRL